MNHRICLCICFILMLSATARVQATEPPKHYYPEHDPGLPLLDYLFFPPQSEKQAAHGSLRNAAIVSGTLTIGSTALAIYQGHQAFASIEYGFNDRRLQSSMVGVFTSMLLTAISSACLNYFLYRLEQSPRQSPHHAPHPNNSY